MSEKTRIPLAEAKALALEVVTLLTPVNSRIEIGGSIRRGSYWNSAARGPSIRPSP